MPAVLVASTAMTPMRQLWVVAVAVASLAVAMAILLVQALRQLPLDQLHPLALAAVAICAISLLAADASVAVALLERRQAPNQPPGGRRGSLADG